MSAGGTRRPARSRSPRSISARAPAVAACTSPKPSSASVVPSVTTSSTSAPAPSPDGVDAQQPEAAEHERLHERDQDPERDEDAVRCPRRARPAARRTCARHWTGSAPRRAGAQGEAARRPPRGASHQPDEQKEQDPDRDQGVVWIPDEGRHGRGTCLDPAAEEVRRAGAEDPAGGHGVASERQRWTSDGLGPLCLEVRAGRAVVERLLQLAPASLERDPRERLRSRGGVARNRLHDGPDLVVRPEGVVAADPRVRRAAEVEGGAELVRVAAGGRVDDRVRPVDELELLVAPVGLLGALVRAVADRGRLLVQRLGGIGRVEVELDHLPVAFVRVVEVVEDVEEPVLERELARMGGVGRRRARRRSAASVGEEMALPELVVAARDERAARVVEVVLVAVDEVLRARADLHQVGRVPGPAQRDGRLRRKEVDVEWDRTALRGRTPPAARRGARPGCTSARAPPRLGSKRSARGGREQSGRDHEREQRDMTRAYRHAARFDARRRIPLRLSCCSPSGPARRATGRAVDIDDPAGSRDPRLLELLAVVHVPHGGLSGEAGS